MPTTLPASPPRPADGAPTGSPASRPRTRRRSRHGLVLVAVLAGLALVVAASLLIGSRLLDPGTVWHALTGGLDPGSAEAVIVANRLRRTVLGLVVGASLAVAGAAMQGVTRNPLGDPGILGINSGSTCAVVVGIAWMGASEAGQYAVWAVVGAGVAGLVVYAIASMGRDGATPIKLALVGAAFSAGTASVTSTLILQRQETLDSFRMWQIGSLTRASYTDVLVLLPLVVLGLALTVGLSSSINNFALGDDMARSLGEKVALKRGIVFLGVTLLCGACVALAGPIAFLGLMVPHALRALCGPDYRWLMPLSALVGPVVLLLADAVGRVVLPPTEVQVGVSMAVLGVPVFILLIRSRKAATL